MQTIAGTEPQAVQWTCLDNTEINTVQTRDHVSFCSRRIRIAVYATRFTPTLRRLPILKTGTVHSRGDKSSFIIPRCLSSWFRSLRSVNSRGILGKFNFDWPQANRQMARSSQMQLHSSFPLPHLLHLVEWILLPTSHTYLFTTFFSWPYLFFQRIATIKKWTQHSANFFRGWPKMWVCWLKFRKKETRRKRSRITEYSEKMFAESAAPKDILKWQRVKE